jgi:hypothetical protein
MIHFSAISKAAKPQNEILLSQERRHEGYLVMKV